MIEETRKHIHDLYYLAKELEEQLERSHYPSDWLVDSLITTAGELMLDIRFEDMLDHEIEQKKKFDSNSKWSIPKKYLKDE